VRRLIVNADGFGFTFGNNRAILEVLPHGFIRSVSANVTWPAVKDVTTILRDFPHVSVGVHLNLTVGPSILPAREVPSLVGSDGEFHGNRFPALARKGLLNLDEMKRELRAQVRRLRDLGVPISHWDSHQGRHLLPGYFEAARDVGLEEGIRASRSHTYYLILPGNRPLGLAKYYLHHPRQVLTHVLAAGRMRNLRRAGVRLPDHRILLNAMGPAAVYRPECWQTLLEKLPEGTGFIECHPGYPDEQLKKYSSMVESREKELQLFRDPAWLDRARAAGVEMVSCAALE